MEFLKKISARSRERDSKDEQPYLSIVIPVYNEADNIELLWRSLYKVLNQLGKTFEVIFVDDGSTDGTREILANLAHDYPAVKAILFRANFGQSAAMAAGFKKSAGQVVIAMDGDLQNDPADIPKLLARLGEGYDVVSGWRKNRQDNYLIRKVPSKIANRIICSVTDVTLHDTGCSLKAFRGDLLRRISLYGELHRFIPALLRREGARITELPVSHHARKFGTSKYNLSRTFRVIMDLITIRFLLRHLSAPLNFFATFSFFCLFTVLLLSGFGLFAIWHDRTPFSELNILVILILLLCVTGIQFLFYGLVAKLIVQSGSRRLSDFQLFTKQTVVTGNDNFAA